MENYMKILAGNIAALRRDAGMTQDALAAQLGVTFQAVSKWENELSCPDIAMLPLLADIFGVSVDALLGRSTKSEEKPTVTPGAKMSDLPWEDDDTVRGMVFIGRRLMSSNDDLSKFKFIIEGKPMSVSSNCNIECSSIQGGAHACCDINCGGGISGGAQAECDINTRGGISGGAGAGADINCGGGISGGATAGCDISCHDISGGVSSGGDITAGGKISGAVNCGGDLTCTSIEGDVICHGDINYK